MMVSLLPAVKELPPPSSTGWPFLVTTTLLMPVSLFTTMMYARSVKV